MKTIKILHVSTGDFRGGVGGITILGVGKKWGVLMTHTVNHTRKGSV
jgi:hypothetical protein